MLPILVIGLLFFPFGCYADAYQQEAMELFEKSKELKSDYLSDALNIKNFTDQKNTHFSCQENKGSTELIQEQETFKKPSTLPRYYVFVSFSMPEPALKALYQEIEHENAILVLRGLYQDSFRQTAKKLKHLKIVADINPNLFKQYQISTIPAFVVEEGEKYSILRGHVTFQFASQKLQESME